MSRTCKISPVDKLADLLWPATDSRFNSHRPALEVPLAVTEVATAVAMAVEEDMEEATAEDTEITMEEVAMVDTALLRLDMEVDTEVVEVEV